MRVVNYPRRYLYPVLGFFLALGAPGGLLLLRASISGELTNVPWMIAEVTGRAFTYGYIAAATAIVFVGLGGILGSHEDLLKRVSLSDSLTGLPNRRHLERRLREELARVERYRHSLALMLLDLDGLKAVNDKLGHEAGDNAIKAVARTLQNTCRATDLAARFGGDEFAVLAPNITEEAALALAERIRKSLRTEATWVASGLPALTLSIGVADTRCIKELHPDRLYTAADRALYQAKQEGRDRVVLAPLEPPDASEAESDSEAAAQAREASG